MIDLRINFSFKSENKSALQNQARLLHQLYPQEIIGFIEFTKRLAYEIINDEEELERVWEHNHISLQYLLNLEDLVFKYLNYYGDSLYHSATLFSEKLFDEKLLFFVVYALSEYQKSKHCTNGFSQSLDLFDFWAS